MKLIHWNNGNRKTFIPNFEMEVRHMKEKKTDCKQENCTAKEYTTGIPAGCRACGGPYPNCKDSCPLFDD